MTISDSLQTFSADVLYKCSKLVSSSIKIDNKFKSYSDKTSAAVAYLRSQQLLSTTPPAPHADDFCTTVDFRRLFVGFVHDSTLMNLQFVLKAWKAVAEEVIDEGVESGEIIVHDGKDISGGQAVAREARRKDVTKVIFLLNTTKVGISACHFTANLIIVNIPKGIEGISTGAFCMCDRLTTASFPTMLTSSDALAFCMCSSLDNVDLLHTNLQELGSHAFWGCSELKSMTVPDSLQKFGGWVFSKCSNIVPSNINVTNPTYDTTYEVVVHLQ